MILTWKNRKKLKASIFIPSTLMMIAGIIPGAFLLKNADVQRLKVVFGIVVILIGVEMFLREYQKKQAKDSKAALAIIGILSGLLCGMFGIGALLAAYVGRVTKESDEFKGNISAVFIVDNTFRIVMYSMLGVLTLATLKKSLILMPVMLLGLFVGMKSAKRLDDKIIKKLVIILLILSGVALIVNNI